MKYKIQKTLCVCVLIAVALFSKAATVDTAVIYSQCMHKNVKCVVITPDRYQTDTTHLPVLYLLHGWSGNYSDWVLSDPGLLNEVDKNGFIVVCPDGDYDSWYLNSPVDTTMQYETNVALEIPAYIDAHYRTIASRNARAITGLSMGGHGALYLALKHKDIFGAAGSMSGGVDFRPFPDKWGIKKYLGDYNSNKENWDKNVVINLVDSLQNGELKIIFDCGVNDFFIQVNRDLHQKLLDKKIDHDYTERPGEHNWNYWNNSIKYQMLFFHQFFTDNNVLN
ncbi:MAG TPA: alpha/beta hydrolase family protein [Chitinophagaceae bacterium]|nr:alpha/beta hydrolase family protein [Chitinophagaceae bacterium]